MSDAVNVGSNLSEQTKRLFDKRRISKMYDREGRRKAFLAIQEAKNERACLQDRISDEHQKLDHVQQSLDSLKALREERLEMLRQFEDSAKKNIWLGLSQRLKKLLWGEDAFAKTLKEAISKFNQNIEVLLALAEEIEDNLQRLTQDLATIPSTKEILAKYYEQVPLLPLSREEKLLLLKPEVLSELSLEEYMKLWQRLNPHFLTHVTRQGFRDDVWTYHNVGLNEFHNNFTSLLRDGRILRPSLALLGLRSRNESTVKRFLEPLLSYPTKEEAIIELDRVLNCGLAASPKYPDSTSVHFAAQSVSENLYGSEQGNNIFVVYPTDVLASQHLFAFVGSQDGFDNHNGMAWNDVFVWPRSLENPGISIDSGIVFLPEDTLVDPETGSKYASKVENVDGNNVRVKIKDDAMIAAFAEWAENLSENSPVIQTFKKYQEQNTDGTKDACFRAVKDEMINLGFTPEVATNLASFLTGINTSSNPDLRVVKIKAGFDRFLATGTIYFGSSKEEAAILLLEETNSNWKRPANPITSKEYWENYFSNNPNDRPKRIVYYKGNPTKAVLEFLRKYGIEKSDLYPLDEFRENHVSDMKNDIRVWAGYDELLQVATEIINQHYSTQSRDK